MPQHHDDYSPEAIQFWLHHWPALISATQGGTNSGNGAGRGDRMALACLKADLECAADRLPVYWQSTAWIYSRQCRSKSLQQRRQRTPALDESVREYESPIPAQALDDACNRMARALGWTVAFLTA